jgi:hypothetical protein
MRPAVAQFDVGFLEPEALNIALYVRDALGLDPETSPRMPRLDPPVAALTAVTGQRNLEHQWARWWSQLMGLTQLSVDGTFVPIDYFGQLDGEDQLQPAAEPLLHRAKAWHLRQLDAVSTAGPSRDPASDCFLPRRVSGAARSILSRRTRQRLTTFRFLVLPVAGQHGWRLREGRYLVSKPLLHDAEAFEDWLRGQFALEESRSKPGHEGDAR